MRSTVESNLTQVDMARLSDSGEVLRLHAVADPDEITQAAELIARSILSQ